MPRRHAVEVLRLAYWPVRVTTGGAPPPLRNDLVGEGYVVRRLAGGDAVVRVRHDGSRSIAVDGR